MEIKPTYVTFEQAIGLKEKGFNIPVNSFYQLSGKDSYEGWGKYKKQVPTADYNAFPKNPNAKPFYKYGYSRPEQWQVVEWLRVNHGIWITPIPRLNSWIFSIVEVKTSNHYSLIDIDFYGIMII